MKRNDRSGDKGVARQAGERAIVFVAKDSHWFWSPGHSKARVPSAVPWQRKGSSASPTGRA
jgi:hypothetical protein